MDAARNAYPKSCPIKISFCYGLFSSLKPLLHPLPLMITKTFNYTPFRLPTILLDRASHKNQSRIQAALISLKRNRFTSIWRMYSFLMHPTAYEPDNGSYLEL